MRKTPLMQRFWTKVQIPETPDGCWLWTASTNTSGYGQIINDFGKMKLASHISYEIYNGAIPDRLQVLHTCDNPLCVNPNHLWLGTHADNMQDRHDKGRDSMRKGHPSHPHRKMTKENIQRAKELYQNGMTQKEIAILMGVHKMTINRAIAGKYPILE